jgi:hypothetical protein
MRSSIQCQRAIQAQVDLKHSVTLWRTKAASRWPGDKCLWRLPQRQPEFASRDDQVGPDDGIGEHYTSRSAQIDDDEKRRVLQQPNGLVSQHLRSAALHHKTSVIRHNVLIASLLPRRGIDRAAYAYWMEQPLQQIAVLDKAARALMKSDPCVAYRRALPSIA